MNGFRNWQFSSMVTVFNLKKWSESPNISQLKTDGVLEVIWQRADEKFEFKNYSLAYAMFSMIESSGIQLSVQNQGKLTGMIN